MFCRECGSEVSKKTKACPNCGVKPLSGSKYCQDCGAKTKSKQNLCKKCGVELIYKGEKSKDDTPVVAKAASFCMPVVGLILYLVWRTNKPQAARSVCDWTILGLAFGMILYVSGIIMGLFGS